VENQSAGVELEQALTAWGQLSRADQAFDTPETNLGQLGQLQTRAFWGDEAGPVAFMQRRQEDLDQAAKCLSDLRQALAKVQEQVRQMIAQFEESDQDFTAKMKAIMDVTGWILPDTFETQLAAHAVAATADPATAQGY